MTGTAPTASLRISAPVFELTFSGGWPNYARTLVEDVNPAYSIFFFIYIIAVTFAMFRIITMLFLRDTLALANSDAEMAVREKQKQQQRYAGKLMDFFNAADSSGDGFLSASEFQEILSNSEVKTWLSVMELDVHDADELFKMLDNGDGEVSAAEFVEGILRLKGGARSQDVMKIMHASQKLLQEMSALRERTLGKS